MRKRLTTDDYHKIAEDKGLIWLGKGDPPGYSEKTPWQCQNKKRGHTWESTYGIIRRSKHCPHCNKKSGYYSGALIEPETDPTPEIDRPLMRDWFQMKYDERKLS